MRGFLCRLRSNLEPNSRGMELVQVAILIAIAIAVGLLFNRQLTNFVNSVFRDLLNARF